MWAAATAASTRTMWRPYVIVIVTPGTGHMGEGKGELFLSFASLVLEMGLCAI